MMVPKEFADIHTPNRQDVVKICKRVRPACPRSMFTLLVESAHVGSASGRDTSFEQAEKADISNARD